MNNKLINKIVKKINKLTNNKKFEIGIVCGSGVEINDLITEKIVISYESLKMPKGRVKGHSGCFVFGKIGDKNVIAASRYHYYECLDMNIVKLPYLIMKELGVETVIMQSSSAGINDNFEVGDIINITNHINYTGNNPLLYFEELKFVNMSEAYNLDYINIVKNVCKKLSIKYKSGTHIQFLGPNYETLAEINMAKMFGADTISMSMVYDNLICRYLDIKVMAFAIITNIASSENIKTLSHIEVLENCKKANTTFIDMVKNVIAELKSE